MFIRQYVHNASSGYSLSRARVFWFTRHAPSTLPATLVATSRDEEGNIMSLRHRTLPLFGLQFHPESVMTDCGLDLLAAFLRLVASRLR